jgi:dCMP deaminase
MRPNKDQWAISLAQVTAKRATCLRRQVGCVLLSARGHVLATGYNGVAAGQKHCNEVVIVGANYRQFGPDPAVQKPEYMVDSHPHACPGAHSASGTNLDGCQAIHAEQNALLQCRDVYTIHTCYVTASPCITCVKLLLNTSCEKIVFTEEYPHKAAQELWVQTGREWQQFT